MCGITGFWTTGTRPYEADEVLASMLSTLEHRGPDDEGTWTDPARGVYLGHRRLSVLDLSVTGHQPMVSHSGRYVITYNGEVFNLADLRRELGPLQWRGHSDTEVMLAAFDRWGVEPAVRRFNGQFAMAVWDTEANSMFLVRDRIGIKPLYVGRFRDTLLFGSELKPLLMHPSFERKIDFEAVARFLERGYILGATSIYHRVRKIQPGQILKLQAPDEDSDAKRYWSIEGLVDKRNEETFDDDGLLHGLEDLLRDAVRLRVVADVPVGAFLSGGIDSSLIAALMVREAKGVVKTFSVGFAEAAYDEAPHATRIASHLGTDHTNLYVAPGDVIDVLAELPKMYDEPFADVSQLPTALISRLARRSVTVCLSGDGGDELFGGYGRYGRAIQYWDRVSRVPGSFRWMLRGAAASIEAFERSKLGRKPTYSLAPLLSRSAMPGQVGRQLELLGAPSANAFYKRSLRLNAGSLTNPGLRGSDKAGAFRSSHGREGVTFLEFMMFEDMLTYLPDDILVKVDRASMNVALEVRVPILDHRVVEFSLGIPERMKMRGGQTKWMLRQLLRRYVPEALSDRPKQGFDVPIGDWIRGPLRDWSEALLDEDDIAAGGLLDPYSVRSIWHLHLSGKRDFGTLLWRILSLRLWLEQTVEPVARRPATVDIT